MEDSYMRIFIALLLLAPTLNSQMVNQVNKGNKTIAVSAEASVQEQPDLAFLKVGFRADGPTREDVLKSVTTGSAKVLKGLLDAKIPKTDIETENLEINELSNRYNEASAEDLKTRR